MNISTFRAFLAFSVMSSLFLSSHAAFCEEATPGCCLAKRQRACDKDLKEYKKIAEKDVLFQGPANLEEKMSFYAEDAVVWDPVMKVVGFNETNTVTGVKEIRKFFTYLAGLPAVNAKILNVFGEGNKVVVDWLLMGGEGDKKFEIPCAHLYYFEKGKIKTGKFHFDSATFANIIKK